MFAKSTLGLAVVCFLGVGSASAADVSRLRVLLILDTTDPQLAPGVQRDRRSIERVLTSHLPTSRYTIDVLEGPAATPERVLGYYRNLTVNPNDGLLCYYSGHGSMRTDLGHTLELRRGASPLARSELKKAMTAKSAQLTVLLTDCCSDRFRNDRTDRELFPPVGPTELSPLARRLFFDARGVIDLTASDKDVAYADDYRGGYFTHAFCTTAQKNRSRPLDWREFAAAVQTETATIHKQAIEDGIAPQLRSGERHQQPVAITPLPTGLADKTVTAVVGLVNPTETAVEVEYRWSDSQPWMKLTIPPGGRKALGARVRGLAANAPAIRVRTAEDEQVLPAKPWEQEGAPRFSDGKIYRFAPKPAATTKTPMSRSLFKVDPNQATAPDTDDPPVEGLTVRPPEKPAR